MLPVTTMYERDDFALTFQQFQATPFRQATEAVVDAPGEARTEWDIVDDLTRGWRVATPVFAVLGIAKGVGRLRESLHPARLVDAMIRLSEGGDRFGLRRGGLTFRRLIERRPHGVVVEPHLRTDVLDDAVAYLDVRVRLASSRYRGRGGRTFPF